MTFIFLHRIIASSRARDKISMAKVSPVWNNRELARNSVLCGKARQAGKQRTKTDNANAKSCRSSLFSGAPLNTPRPTESPREFIFSESARLEETRAWPLYGGFSAS